MNCKGHVIETWKNVVVVAVDDAITNNHLYAHATAAQKGWEALRITSNMYKHWSRKSQTCEKKIVAISLRVQTTVIVKTFQNIQILVGSSVGLFNELLFYNFGALKFCQ